MISLTAYFMPHSSMRGQTLPRSDTLFGAICWGMRLLFGAERLEDTLHAFTQQKAPFLISSMYACMHTNEGIVHYFPKPLTNPYIPASFADNPPKMEELMALKRLNAMHTVGDTDFSDILQGKKTDADFYEQCLDAVTHAPKAAFPASRVVSAPHASVNRLTSNRRRDRVFYTEECVFHAPDNGQQPGVFFCATCRDDFVQELKAVICFLADKGIGAGASSGKGHFRSVTIVDDVPYREPPADASTHVMTLSLTYPDDELKQLLSRSWYALERRQGKIESMYASVNAWKDSLLMLREGSTFPQNGQQQYGMNAIVRKAGDGLDFDVWQYGFAFTVNTQHIIPS